MITPGGLTYDFKFAVDVFLRPHCYLYELGPFRYKYQFQRQSLSLFPCDGVIIRKIIMIVAHRPSFENAIEGMEPVRQRG
jgi:hypothetical protein